MLLARLLVLSGCLGAAGLLLACGDAAAPEERVGGASAPIINGQLDTTHLAVVAYFQGGGKCSATIVATDGSTGWAVTAAHCISSGPAQVVQGNNHDKPDVVYPVQSTTKHPGYAKSKLYDFAVVKFTGATGATPTIPLLSPAQDKLKNGAGLDMVGYGQTQNNGGYTSQRWHKTMTVSDVTDLRLVYDQKGGGMCSGDSGGPSLVNLNGQELLAGVHSYVSGDCLTQGTDMRVSAAYDTFLLPTLTGQPTQAQTCDQCFEANTASGACNQAVIDCFDDGDCSAYADCVQKCSTNACVNQCVAQHPSGSQLYAAIFSCICASGCPSECANASYCNLPACGLSSSKPGCQSCMEASCCGQATACSQSAGCVECLASTFPPQSCDSDPTVQALIGCLGTYCSEPCNVAPPGEGGSGGSGSGAGGGSEGAGAPSGGGAPVGGAGGGTPTDTEPSKKKTRTILVEDGCSLVAVAPARGGDAAWLGLLAALGLASALRRAQRAHCPQPTTSRAAAQNRRYTV